MKKDSAILIFDFDKTFFKKDSMYLFFNYMLDKNVLFKNYLFFFFWLMLNINKNTTIKKEKLIKIMLNSMGYNTNKFNKEKYDNFFIDNKKYINQNAINVINSFENPDIFISTASLDIWVSGFLEKNMNLIHSKYEFKNSGFKLIENNKGVIKMINTYKRIKSIKNKKIYAFGDSNEDKMLKQISDVFLYKNFNLNIN